MMGGRDFAFRTEAAKPKAAGATLARLWIRFREHTPVLLTIACLIVVSTYLQVTIPNLLGQAVDCYLTPATINALAATNPDAAVAGAASGTNCWFTKFDPGAATTDYKLGLSKLVLLIVVMYVGSSLLTGLQFFLMNSTGYYVLRGLRVDVFKHIHRLSLGYFTQHEAGDVMSRITNDADTIQQAIGFPLVSVVQGSLLLVWIAYNMVSDSPAYAVVSLSIVPIMYVATSWFSENARRAYRKVRTRVGDVNANLQENLSAVREAQAFNREGQNIQAFSESNAASRDASIEAVAYTSALQPTLEALGYCSIALVAGIGALVLLKGQHLAGTTMSFGLIITFIAYVQRFNQPVSQISIMWTNIQSAVAGGERIFGFLDTEPDLKDRPDAGVMPPIQGRVVLDHVWAEYVPGQPVLRDVSLVAEPGQTIAIVGPTGSGKTTTINLIPRFWDVTGGAVLIDGIDVRDVTAASLRAQIGIVLQDSFLFSESVLNNIRYGRPEATDEECIAAAKLARADTFIERLPEGYNTILGERGSGLSQGQRQLLAIARAALADPRILILDEATSSVDTRTERLIQKALEELLRGRTSFVIAHRLSTIRNADQVLALKDGQIIEQGTHDELLRARGFYYNLYMSQFRRDLEFATVATAEA
ncbi:MAG TPA: ABC transporter ATP-binding protein [Chloroflexota bacterium]|nr:ABC transporter ATP-binding protein [Chloroflexota bacterium]